MTDQNEADATADAAREKRITDLQRTAFARTTSPQEAARALEAQRLLAIEHDRYSGPAEASAAADADDSAGGAGIADGSSGGAVGPGDTSRAGDTGTAAAVTPNADLPEPPPRRAARWRIVAGVAAVAAVATVIALLAGPGAGVVASLAGPPAPTSTLPVPDPDLIDKVEAELGSPPKGDSLSSSEADAIIAANNEQHWQQVLRSYPQAVRPEVAVIRQLEYHESMDVHADCLRSRGVEVTRTADDSMRYDLTTEAAALADYQCLTEYPSRPEPGPNDEQIGYIYDYQVKFAVPCLENLGYEQEPPPSREDFISGWREGSSWYPAPPASINRFDLLEAIAEACPSDPGGIS